MVKELSGENMLETKFKIDTKIKNLGSLDINFSDLNFDVRSNNMAELRNELKLPWPDWKIFNATDFEAAGVYNGNLHEGTIKINALADDTKAEYDGLMIILFIWQLELLNRICRFVRILEQKL